MRVNYNLATHRNKVTTNNFFSTEQWIIAVNILKATREMIEELLLCCFAFIQIDRNMCVQHRGNVHSWSDRFYGCKRKCFNNLCFPEYLHSFLCNSHFTSYICTQGNVFLLTLLPLRPIFPEQFYIEGVFINLKAKFKWAIFKIKANMN